MDLGQASYYAAVGGGSSGETEGSLDFQIDRHEEDWKTNYNVQLYKYEMCIRDRQVQRIQVRRERCFCAIR